VVNFGENLIKSLSSDFVVGEDEFSSLEIRDGELGNGFYYFFDNKYRRLIKRFILNESKSGIKTCCTVTFIEKDGKYSPRLEFLFGFEFGDDFALGFDWWEWDLQL
jgi:hypothetical protein